MFFFFFIRFFFHICVPILILLDTHLRSFVYFDFFTVSE